VNVRTQMASLGALARSRFRTSFSLSAEENAQLADTAPETLRRQARRIIAGRLAPARPANDGRQTPYRGHPVFVAQHATATCCRRCAAKWHGIEAGKVMSDEEVMATVDVICSWLELRRRPARQMALDL
jgi:hypothetical protein